MVKPFGYFKANPQHAVAILGALGLLFGQFIWDLAILGFGILGFESLFGDSGHCFLDFVVAVSLAKDQTSLPGNSGRALRSGTPTDLSRMFCTQDPRAI